MSAVGQADLSGRCRSWSAALLRIIMCNLNAQLPNGLVRSGTYHILYPKYFALNKEAAG